MTQVVLIETIGKVGLIRINRPEAMNALNNDVVDGIGAAIDAYEADENIGCIVITGNEKAFAAGADIGFMKDFDYMHAYKTDFITRNWERIKTTRKPVIAAVSGFALGGGCEMAMMCDMIFAADTAKFGQPEIKLGTLPGAGGTQRLPRAVGKAKAMDMCLTGRMMDAAEAEKSGLVARVIPADQLLEETLKAATTIASISRTAATSSCSSTTYVAAAHVCGVISVVYCSLYGICGYCVCRSLRSGSCRCVLCRLHVSCRCSYL